jgi:hypothetical protein
VPENERVEQRENLIRRCQYEREQDQAAVLAEVGVEESHPAFYWGGVRLANDSRTLAIESRRGLAKG